MWQNSRSLEQEILDLGPEHYTQEEYDTCLKLLCRINWLLGGFKATLRSLRELKRAPSSILEVGCGGGYLCHYLQQWFPEAKVLGIDLSEAAIKHAKDRLPWNPSAAVGFQVQKDKALDFADNEFDVVTTMLVCHHMTDEELVAFLQDSYRVCAQAVVINDLHRHVLAYISFSLITPVMFCSRLVWHDGRLSVRRSFRKSDWVDLMQRAGFEKKQYSLKWNWAFRWTLTLKK